MFLLIIMYTYFFHQPSLSMDIFSNHVTLHVIVILLLLYIQQFSYCIIFYLFILTIYIQTKTRLDKNNAQYISLGTNCDHPYSLGWLLKTKNIEYCARTTGRGEGSYCVCVLKQNKKMWRLKRSVRSESEIRKKGKIIFAPKDSGRYVV